MRFLILLVIFPSFVYADQGVKISCVNMKNLLDQNYKIHKFKFDVTTFQYFDEKKIHQLPAYCIFRTFLVELMQIQQFHPYDDLLV